MRIRQKLLKFFGSRYFFAWAVIAGLAFRVVWGFYAGDAYRYYDSDSYVKIADNLRSGNGFLWGDQQSGQRLGRPPLYPLLVAATRFTINGREFLLLYMVQGLLGMLSVIFFSAGARRLVGRAAGGITALLVAFDPFLVFYSGTVLSETLFVFFLSALFYSVIFVLEKPGLVAAAFAGVFAGAAFLTRPSVPGVAVLFALTILVWARPRWRAVASVIVIVLVSLLVVTPWALRNHRLTGRWVFTTLGVGASLYDAIGPQADGSSNMSFLHSMPELNSMDEVSRDEYLFDKSVDAFLDSPGRVLKLALVKASRFWSPIPNNEGFRSPLYIFVSLAFALPIYVFAIMSVFAGVLRRRDFFLLSSPLVYFTLVHTIFVGSVRYRCPVMPFAAILAATFLAALLARGKKGLAAAYKHRVEAAKARRKSLKAATSHKLRGLWSPFRIILLVFAILGVAAAAGYAYYVNWVANPANVRAIAIDKIGLLFPGKEIRVENAHFGLLSGLDLRGVEILEPGGAPSPIAKLGFVFIDFERRGFLKFALIPKKVTASELYLELIRGEGGAWNLALPLSGGPTVPAAPVIPVAVQREVSVQRRKVAREFLISLTGAFISIDDRHDHYSVSFPIDSVTAISDQANMAAWRVGVDFGSGVLGKWRVDAHGDTSARMLNVAFRAADVDLGEGLSNRLPPGARSVYDHFKPSGRAQVSGTFGFSPATGWDLDITADVNGCGMTLLHFPVAVRDIHGLLHFTKAGCSFAEMTGAALGGSFVCSGQTTSYSQHAGYHVNLEAKEITVTDELLSALREQPRNIIESLQPKGLFDISARIDSEEGPDRPAEVALDIYPKGVSAVYRDFPYPLEGLTGHISCAGNSVRIDNLTGRAGGTKVVFNGAMRDTAGSCQTDLTISAAGLQLDDTLRGVLPGETASAWEDLGLSGACDVDARISKKADLPLSLEFDAHLADVAVRPRDFPYALYSGTGWLRFKDNVVTFDSLRFRHGESAFSFDGQADVKAGTVNLNVSCGDVVIDDELTAALPAAGRDFLRRTGLVGRCDATAAISRDREGKTTFSDLRAELTGAQLAPPDMPINLGAASVSFDLSQDVLEVSRLESLVMNESALDLMPAVRLALLCRPPTSIAAAGRTQTTGERPAWQVRFEADTVFVDDSLAAKMPQPLRGQAEWSSLHGLVRLSAEARYTPEGAGGYYYDGVLDSADAGLFVGLPLESVKGRVTADMSSTGSEGSIRAVADLATLTLAGRELFDTHLTLVQEKDELRLENLRTRTFGGTLQGWGRVILAAKPSYALSATARGMDFSQLVEKAFAFHKEGLSGDFNGSLSLLCRTGEMSDMIGSANADITNGTLWEVPMILAMMNVINLRIPERTKFNSAHVNLNWTDKGVIVNELSMASDPATLFGTGFIDSQGGLDMMFYSQPGKIPIVSALAGKVGKNIVRAHMTGTFDKPKVGLVPSGPFGSLLDAIKRAFGKEGK